MGARLATFDYSMPYFYMVTIKRHAGLEAFSEIVEPGECRLNAITRSFVVVIRGFHEIWRCIEPITCFSIMPDHIHLLIMIRNVDKRVTVPKIVWQLKRHLERAYWEAIGGATASGTLSGRGAGGMSVAESRAGGLHVFERDWHDWIVKVNGQLKAFTRYIRENPMRHWVRRSHSAYFQRVGEIEFLGRKWYGYGNAAILDLPVVEPFRCSRKWQEGGAEWSAAVARAERIGPGGAGIGTFMSLCEKACGNAIANAGGRLVVLSPEGFGARWHPRRNHERFCAEGRMLFLSLYPEMARQPTREELYRRCHEMGDIVVEGLAHGRQERYA